MAKKMTKKKPAGKATQPAPSKLTMDLFAPGMSMLHRAGLGGLACTLKHIEYCAKNGQIPDDALPGGPWSEGPPWKMTSRQIVLDFGVAEQAREFLKRLFTQAFQLKDSLIFLPGQYRPLSPPPEVLISLQKGLTLTYLQHNKTIKLASKEVPKSYQPEGDSGKTITLLYKECSGYKHQSGWESLIDKKHGRLKRTPINFTGTLSPGSMVRHARFKDQTTIKAEVTHILPLYFAIVGCLTLSIKGGSGVLIVPDVMDLLDFCISRPDMTPYTAKACQITNASDAALQAQIRLRMKSLVEDEDIPACHAITFRQKQWAEKFQKIRDELVMVAPGCDDVLNQFATALAELPPRILNVKKVVPGQTESFWKDSIVRPLVADNLARGHPWYKDFVRLVSTRQLRKDLSYEKKGLYAMIEKIPWKDQGHSVVVRAVHQSLKQRFGQIASENKNDKPARENRWKRERDRWRLAFSHAKTSDQLRRAICDFFSRAGVNSVLQDDWTNVLPMLTDPDQWEITRDLALLGLASYSGAGSREADEQEQQSDESTD